MESACRASVGTPSWRRVQGAPFPVCAPSRTLTIPTVYVRCLRCTYTISLCIYADSRMIGPPRTTALGYEFFNKKLIRGSRRMDAVAAKSDAVTAWKCTITDDYRPLQTLTDADSRCGAFAHSACDWAFRQFFYTSAYAAAPYAVVWQPHTIQRRFIAIKTLKFSLSGYHIIFCKKWFVLRSWLEVISLLW